MTSPFSPRLLLLAALLTGCPSPEGPTDAGRPDAPRRLDAGRDASLPPPVMPPAPPGAPLALPIAPAATCAPSLDVCDAPAAAPLAAGYRKDFFYPLSRYAEASIPDPSSGGRVHVVATSAVSGRVTALRLWGEESTALLDAARLDWIHVWPEELVAGEPVWVSLHSQSAEFDAAEALPLRIETDAGTALDAAVPYAIAEVPLSYVTPTDDGAALLVHLRNESEAPHTLARLIVDGRDVTEAACIPDPTLPPGAATVWRVPACTARSTGAPWTVVVEWADAPPSVAGGRVVPRHFPLHTWPIERECPLPGGNEENFAMHLAAGFDTFFLRTAYTAGDCDVTGAEVIEAAPGRGIFLMPDEFIDLPAGTGEEENVLVRLLADEGDTSRTDGSVRRYAEQAQESWARSPSLTTYVGGARHRNNGTFSGAADLQGFDFYVAACAPHVTDFNTDLPLRGAYDYLHAVRRNHMPLTTWLYSQGLHAGWNRGDLVYQPDPTELNIQAWSAILAGAKGLMYFQTNLELARGASAATWSEITRVNRVVRALRRLFREGDPTGAAYASSEDVLVDAIAGPEALVLMAIDVRNAGGPDDLTCLTSRTPPHWLVADELANLGATLPDGLGVADAFEVTPEGVLPLPDGARLDDRTVWLPAVALDAATPTRIFVLASDASLRAEIAAALTAR